MTGVRGEIATWRKVGVIKIMTETTADGTMIAGSVLIEGMDPHVGIAVALLAATRLLGVPNTTMMIVEGMIGLPVTRTRIVDELAIMIKITAKTGIMTGTETDLDDTEMMGIAAARLIHLGTTVTWIVTAIIAGAGMINETQSGRSCILHAIRHAYVQSTEKYEVRNCPKIEIPRLYVLYGSYSNWRSRIINMNI